MKLSDVVRGEPGQYVAEAGAVKQLPSCLSLFERPVVLTGQQSYAAFERVYGGALPYPVLRYDGTASHEDMERLAEQAQQLGADVLIGIGGGKVLDTTKGAAEKMNVDFVLVPTLVGTCACSTPVAAVYHPDHQFKCIDYYQRSGFMTVVDYALLLQSPREYLLSGISDTLAKWYEAESISRGQKVQDLPAMVQLGLATARLSLDILLRDTETALRDFDAGQLTPAFERIVDTVYAVAANVGCQACSYGRVAGAHAIHNGLTVLPETHHLQHGIKVAYGILVQLCATGDEGEVRTLLPFYKKNGFLYSWKQLGVTKDCKEAQLAVATFAASKNESFHYACPDVTPEQIVAAMEKLEELVSAFERGGAND